MIFKSFLLLQILFIESLCEQVVIKRQKDKTYPGNVFMETSLPSWYVCAELCARLPVCQSVNFIADTGTCQINDNVPYGSCDMNNLINSPGKSFVSAYTFPKVSC